MKQSDWKYCPLCGEKLIDNQGQNWCPNNCVTVKRKQITPVVHGMKCIIHTKASLRSGSLCADCGKLHNGEYESMTDGNIRCVDCAEKV